MISENFIALEFTSKGPQFISDSVVGNLRICAEESPSRLDENVRELLGADVDSAQSHTFKALTAGKARQSYDTAKQAGVVILVEEGGFAWIEVDDRTSLRFCAATRDWTIVDDLVQVEGLEFDSLASALNAVKNTTLPQRAERKDPVWKLLDSFADECSGPKAGG